MSNIIPIDQIRVMANSATQSKMFPVSNPDQAFTLMLIAQAENIHPMSAFMKYDIIQGKPALKSSEVLSRFQQSGGKVEWIQTNAEIAKGKFTHPQGGSITIEWNMQRATKAGYVNKDNWKKHPDQMLRARCVTEAVRAIYPSCLNNMYSSEEVADIIEEEPQVIQDEIIQDVEIVDSNLDSIKKQLATKLKKIGYSAAMIKDFAKVNELGDNADAISILLDDETLFNEALTKYEN